MKKKIIFLGITAVSLITAGVVIPLVLLKNENKKQKEDVKDIVIYADKLKSLKTKTVTISATSGSVTSNKQNIINAIKKLDNFPQIPNGISLDIKDSNKNLTIGGISIILVVKKEGETDIEIEGFKVKRSKNATELASDSIKNVKKILDDKSLKLVTIENVQAKVGATGVDYKIIEKLKETIGSTNLDGVTISVKADSIDANIVNVGEGIGFIITLSKGEATPVEITNWKVKRIESNVELATKSINNVKKILDDKGSKLVTIENIQAKVGASGVAAKIIAKLQEAIGSANLEGVTISVKADTANADIIDTGSGIGFIITLLKGSAPSEEIINWKVIRTKPKVEQDKDAINNVKKILDDKNSKLVTIINVQAKVGTSGVAVKIIAKLEEIIGSSNLEGVTINVKADTANADIIDTGLGTGFIITLSKGEADLEEISNWKVIRTKPTVEQDKDAINNVKKILDDKDLKLVTIENAEAKVGTSGVANKIVAKLEEAIGSSNLEGVTISVKADTANADIIDTGSGIGFIMTLSKGSAQPEEIINWKVKRTKVRIELDTDAINNVKTILDSKDLKLVTIENAEAKVGASGVALKIAAKLEEAIGSSNLKGVIIDVKADTANADIIDTGEGIGFIITLSKGSAQPVEIIDWKVKRTRSNVEQATNSINNVRTILDNKDLKLVTIENLQAKVGASGVANKIITKLEEAIGSDNLEGVIIDVKADTANADIIDTGQGIGFIITLLKGEAQSVEISNWKVKRTKPAVELDKDSINNVKLVLDRQSPKLVTIENLQAKVGSSGVANKIIAKLIEAIGSSNLEGVTISVKPDTTNADIIDTGSGIGFIITLSKGEAEPEEISNWKVKRTKLAVEQDKDAINNVKLVLDRQSPKLVTIENIQAKVGSSGVANKIIAKLQEAIGPDNLEGVIISVKADTTNADIIDTGQGIGFIITLLKGEAQPEEITNWKVKRTKLAVELDTESINNVKTILDNKDLKLVTIENIQAKVETSGVAAKIIAKLEEAIGPGNLEGVIISVKADTTNADIIDTGQGIGFIITLSKGEANPEEISNWRVKREISVNEEDILAIRNILNSKTGEDLKIILSSNSTGNIIGDATNKNEIIKKLRILIDPSNTNGEANHSSLRGTTISISMSSDAPISTIPQDIIVSISKTGGTTLNIINIFQVMKDFTNVEKITNYLSSINNKIFINNWVSTQNIKKILTAVKDALGTNLDNDQKNLITLNEFVYLAPGIEKSINFGVTGGDDVTLLVTKRNYDAQAIINYFAKKGKKRLSIRSATVLDKNELTTAIQDALEADDALFKRNDYMKNYVTVADDYVYSPFTNGVAQKVKVKIQKDSETPEFITLSIIKRSADVQAIIDYFAHSGRKRLAIKSVTIISDRATLTNAIKEALETDKPTLFDNTKKSYITLANDYVYTSFSKGTAKDVKIKIQKGSETPEFITLSVMHNTVGFDTVNGYFDTNYRFFISNTTATSNRAEILDALKNAIGNNLTPEQKNLIQIRNNTASSLAAGTTELFEYKIVGGIGGNIVWIVKRSVDAQAIIDYFAQAGKKNLSIPSTTVISDKATLISAIQEALGTDDSTLFDNTKKAYVTVASDYTYSAFTKGTAKDVKVKIQKGSETPEFITLSVTHLEDDPSST